VCRNSLLISWKAEATLWAEQQPDMPSLSEAIRRLVEFGLKAKAK
jgi:hypothetical protein